MSNVLQRLLRGLPMFPGKVRIAKLLLGNLEGPAQVTDRFGFRYDVPDLREPIGFHLWINGAYEPQVQDLVLGNLKPGSVFIDVGANIGTFAIPAAKRVGPTGRVVAIEASPDVFKVLQKNVAVNCADNVQLISAVAGASETETKFYPAPIDHFGMGSRAPQFDALPVTVPSVTLDLLVEKLNLPYVDLIKIDAEGFELEVLKGATELLSGREVPLIVFEFCDWAEARMGDTAVGAAQRFLTERGFKIWRAGDYDRKKALDAPLLTDGDMLVARR